jgi:hypothetical protein
LQSNQLNGRSVVRFDGGTGGSNADYLSVPDDASLKPERFTIFVVGKYDNTGGSASGLFLRKTSNSGWTDGYGLARYATTDVAAYLGTAAAINTPFANNTYAVMEARYDKYQLEVLVNGIGQWMKSGTVLSNSTAPLYLGSQAGDFGLKGDIAEVLVFNDTISVEDEAGVESYLEARYGLNTDADGDGLPYWLEIQLGTAPGAADSNNDGWADGPEYYAGYSPTSNDVDGDGLLNADEIAMGTNPFWNDTDGDLVLDGVDPYPFDPTPVGADPTPTTAPVITLELPTNAVPVP